MEEIVKKELENQTISSPEHIWEMVAVQLRMEMSRALYETWVQPLRPLGMRNNVFVIGAYNAYARDWVESRLGSRITHLIEGSCSDPVKVKFVVLDGEAHPEESRDKKTYALREEEQESTGDNHNGKSDSKRKTMLQRAYGTERARLIQPERGMFITNYYFQKWMPLLGHSAMAVVLAARSLCYWNPMTGELRNVIETDMSELAERAAVSVRTVKTVLNQDLVKQYFIRYLVRRIMTPNGVRTAGISLQVRMDDPLTPDDQAASGLTEEQYWYLPEFEGDERDDEV